MWQVRKHKDVDGSAGVGLDAVTAGDEVVGWLDPCVVESPGEHASVVGVQVEAVGGEPPLVALANGTTRFGRDPEAQ